MVVASQWRAVAGYGGLLFVGLDYQGVCAGLDAAGIELTPDLFAALQVMEGAAVEALNARKGA
ncbi:hypothetical protein AUC70_11705 [Methyloceanibacter stevinii]|uniref:Uncharacterized protein n=1 Tax=Methyloceanibacter stevinii TaxID=1774970 RepID=A0A1E3VJK0_9HYPH|nr:hypothetical protein AUC70_11705 [Methyloceanibacter stevinii]